MIFWGARPISAGFPLEPYWRAIGSESQDPSEHSQTHCKLVPGNLGKSLVFIGFLGFLLVFWWFLVKKPWLLTMVINHG